MSKVTLGPSALTGCVTGVEYAVISAKNGVRPESIFRGSKDKARLAFDRHKSDLMYAADKGDSSTFEVGLYELRPLDVTKYEKPKYG